MFILNIGKGSDRIRVAVDVIKLLGTEEGFIVLMFEELAFDGEPAVGIGDELVFILDWGYYLEV